MSDFVNSYSRHLYNQLTRMKKDGTGCYSQGVQKYGAEKLTQQKIEDNEHGAEESAKLSADLARYYRMGMNPPREIMEKIYSNERERG